MKLKLNACPVQFIEDGHFYMYNDQSLTSVTTIIKKHILTSLYAGVDKALLAAKAAYGTAIHRAIELYEMGLPFSFDEFDEAIQARLNADMGAYILYRSKNGYTIQRTEYIVSDCETNAGMVDQVLTKDKVVSLADIKTTYELDTTYLKHQLSIYAHDFEVMNPGVKVEKLFAIHIKDGECREVDIPRLPEEYVTALLEAERDGVEFVDPLKPSCDEAEEIVNEIRILEYEMLDYKAFVSPREKRVKELKERLYKLAREQKLTGFTCEAATVTVGDDVCNTKFDLKALSQNSPKFYARYIKALKKGFVDTVTKGRVTIKFK